MEVYTHAAMDRRRIAQQKAVDHLLGRAHEESDRRVLSGASSRDVFPNRSQI